MDKAEGMGEMSNQNTREAMVTIEPIGELGQRKPGLKRVFDIWHI